MARFNLSATLLKYADDNASQGGTVVDFILSKDVDIWVRWSADKWEDGVPVTKMFGRNRELELGLGEGTRIRGVAYNSWRNDGCAVLDFYLIGVWYSTSRDEAADLVGASTTSVDVPWDNGDIELDEDGNEVDGD